jgi:hypothetical protein
VFEVITRDPFSVFHEEFDALANTIESRSRADRAETIATVDGDFDFVSAMTTDDGSKIMRIC